jgi:ring-1,2-phenylacetyl-CoA epoxidase subunit PaaE
MAKFHPLKIKDLRRETKDCVSITFEIPESLKDEFKYKQGQYLTLRSTIDGEELRRSYSACSSPAVDEDLRIAVKKVEKGRMSSLLNNGIEIGQEIEVMRPMGNFYTEMPAETSKKYVAFAAGSGITPIMSLLKTALATDDQSTFTLFYGNKSKGDIIFKDELDKLEGEYPDRLKVIHVLSREATADPLFSGRISTEKCDQLMDRFPESKNADEYFICGPFDMIKGIEVSLIAGGVDKHHIHFELFTTKAPQEDLTEPAAPDEDEGDGTPVDEATVMIVLDGEETEITVTKHDSILDAALDAGLDAPYACTGGSCCTCRAKVMEGKAIMDVNYALTEQEVEEGYILTCQSHPTTKRMVVDYDEP